MKFEGEIEVKKENLTIEKLTREKLTNENIDDFIEKWHESSEEIELHDFLGWTKEQYAHWVKTDELPN